MSLRALLLATTELLRLPTPQGQTINCFTDGGIGRFVKADAIAVRPPPGRPPALAGEIFVAVWSPDWNNQGTEGFDENYRIMVTISRRSPVKPDDRFQELITDWPLGLLSLADMVRTALHLNYNVLNRANDHIDRAMRDMTGGAQTEGVGFVEPLFFTSGGQTDEKGGSWFKGNQKERAAALTQTLSFGPARRVQDASTTTI